MEVDPIIDEHFPILGALHRVVHGLPNKVTITAVSSGRPRDLPDAEIDAIHQGLLRKQRGGSLGLNE